MKDWNRKRYEVIDREKNSRQIGNRNKSKGVGESREGLLLTLLTIWEQGFCHFHLLHGLLQYYSGKALPIISKLWNYV